MTENKYLLQFIFQQNLIRVSVSQNISERPFCIVHFTEYPAPSKLMTFHGKIEEGPKLGI
jgi:hypothetical protein